MEKTKASSWRYLLKWTIGFLLVQGILINISAAIYAYKFTHFYDAPSPVISRQGFLDQTWKLFVGPTFYKDTAEPAPQFPYSNVALYTSDSIRIDAWYSRQDSARGCVIFFHGLSVNKSFQSNEASFFRQMGYNVLLVDFRGHGRSSGNTSTLGVAETDEVEKAFAFAKANGNQKIILYGASLGAGVCIKAVAEKKLQPEAIIADMPFGKLHDHFKSRARVLNYPAEPFAILVTFWIGVERGYNGFKHNVANYAKEVSCPVLVEWGEQDPYVSRKEIDQVYLNLGSKNKRLVVFPEAGHESFLNADPNGWKKQVNSFLETL